MEHGDLKPDFLLYKNKGFNHIYKDDKSTKDDDIEADNENNRDEDTDGNKNTDGNKTSVKNVNIEKEI
eukprot:9682272-Ditylum_brightwellii.AAC.1